MANKETSTNTSRLKALLLNNHRPAHLVLEDGRSFSGVSIGAQKATSGELIFNTAMSGYQEILFDPSYAEQIICFSYPHIGNTGINTEDQESPKVWAKGLVVHALPTEASNWRSTLSFDEFLSLHEITGIAGVNTRALIQHIRQKGVLRACILSNAALPQAKQIIESTPPLGASDLASVVSTDKVYEWRAGLWKDRKYQNYTDSHFKHHVVVCDFGVKQTILRSLAACGCRITVVPARTPASEIAALKPDGIVLSNGPGDPHACHAIIENIKDIMQLRLPLLGICLGHQLLALACGAKTYKMKFGHHGANHPVFDTRTKTVFISSQNHGYAVSDELPDTLQPTCISLFDKSLQAMQHTELPIISVQGHPEASPGPQDLVGVFTEFCALMEAQHAS